MIVAMASCNPPFKVVGGGAWVAEGSGRVDLV